MVLPWAMLKPVKLQAGDVFLGCRGNKEREIKEACSHLHNERERSLLYFKLEQQRRPSHVFSLYIHKTAATVTLNFDL